jgi:DNA polymerase-3 subunit delta'
MQVMMTGRPFESENKQLFISADEIDDQNQKFSLKSFEGGTKILIVWRADKMNVAASNKFLKFLEEPPAKQSFSYRRIYQ